MDARSLWRLTALCGPMLALVTGCPRPAPPENAVTWCVKAATGQLSEATPNEWQAVADKIDERTPQVDISLTDEQAEALADFIQANDLNTIDQIVDLVEQGQQDPNAIDDLVIPDSAAALFTSGLDDFEGVIGDILDQP